MVIKDLGKTSSGIQANMAALLSYLAGWITGLIFFLVEKDNKFVRFHAMQSIVVFGAFSALGIVISVFSSLAITIHAYFLLPLIGLVSTLLWLVALVLWIVLMIKAYQGEKFKLPAAGDIAEKNI
ncbi:MAG: DUF4870 domain-containing protein [Candidatus Omnitrophica bacterium]|nr:DUF4870 domain-containing protein [Candidatus Omnitrophota bacterium]